MTYEEVVDQINQIRRFGNLAGVEVAGRMLKALGSPQAGIPLIHIAGTNGKGSVSAFLCAILKEAGLRVGMFTSPHLVDFRERIQINGEMISKEDTQRIGARLLAMDFGVQPTMFDVTLAMAILYFKEQRCDVMILETGLGGRLDATNAVGVPDVTVITKIGYDHMAVLGNTLPEIAAEKAGVIKRGTSLVLESQKQETAAVFEAKVREEGITDFRLIDPLEIKSRLTATADSIFRLVPTVICPCACLAFISMRMLSRRFSGRRHFSGDIQSGSAAGQKSGKKV